MTDGNVINVTTPQPRVSVVIPTLNRSHLIGRAVESVLAQSISDIEVIVVVDGIDPATVEVLDRIVAADNRLRYIVHQTSRGAGGARDAGADISRGEWVAFLDDDDEWLPEKLERQLAIAPADRKAVLMTLSRVVTPESEFIRPSRIHAGDEPVDEWLFAHGTWLRGGQAFLQTSSLMFPKAMLDRLHFTDTKQHEEWELVIRAVKQHGYRLLTAPEPVVIHYFDPRQPSLSTKYTWQNSLAWADGLGDLLTPKAYAGFCLIVTARLAANQARRSGALPLLKAAFRKGHPTLPQLLVFVLLWLLPRDVRARARSVTHGRAKLNTSQA